MAVAPGRPGRPAVSVLHAYERGAGPLPQPAHRYVGVGPRMDTPLDGAADPPDRLRQRLGAEDLKHTPVEYMEMGKVLRQHRLLRRVPHHQIYHRPDRRPRVDVRLGLSPPGDPFPRPYRFGDRVARGAGRTGDEQADVGEFIQVLAPDLHPVGLNWAWASPSVPLPVGEGCPRWNRGWVREHVASLPGWVREHVASLPGWARSTGP